MKRLIWTIIFSFLALSSQAKVFKNLTDFNASDVVLGVPNGAVSMTVAEQLFPKAQIKYFNSVADGYAGVEYGKLDGFVFDKHSLDYLTIKNDKFVLFPKKVADEHIVVGVNMKRPDLLKKINQFIASYRADGTYHDMYQRWVKGKSATMPDIPKPQNPTQKVRFVTEGLNEPMNFYGDKGILTGFDVEFIKRFALFANIDFDIETMSFDALILATTSGQADVLVANLNANPEREERMLFSDDYVDSEIGIVLRNDALFSRPKIISWLNKPEKIIGSIQDSAYIDLLENTFPKAQIHTFVSIADAIMALSYKKLDAVIYDKHNLDYVALQNADFEVIPEQIAPMILKVSMTKENTQMQKDVDDFIREYRANGTYQDMYQRWIQTKNPQMPDIKEAQNPTRILKVGTEALNEPMNFYDKNNEITGFDVEFSKRLALKMNAKLEMITLEYNALIPALQAGKIDLIVSAMNETEERKKQVLFSEPYIDTYFATLIRKGSFAKGAFDEFDGKNVGVITGSAFDTIVKKALPDVIPAYFNGGFSDQIEALRNNQISAFACDEPIARDILRSNKDLQMLMPMLDKNLYAWGFRKSDKLLEQKVSALIRQMRKDGTLDELDTIWFSEDESKKVLPPKPEGKNGILKFGVADPMPPFVYHKDGKLVGYEIALIYLIAEKLDYAVEFFAMDIGALMPALLSEKVDSVAGCLSITDERKEQILFSEPDYFGGTLLVTQKAVTETAIKSETFLSQLQSSFYRTFIKEDRYKMVLFGLYVTIIISVFSILFGTFLGCFICAMRRSKRRLLNIPAKIYIRIVQGTPILVLLMILYYIVFAKADLSAIIVAIIAFGINFSAYCSEMFRTGLDALDKGQMEAAVAMGFNKVQSFMKIALPQALKHVLPVFKGEVISTIKMTSVVGYIAIQDLTKVSDIIRSRTYEAFFPLIATALIYFALAYAITLLLTLVEFKIDPKHRKRALKGVKL